MKFPKLFLGGSRSLVAIEFDSRRLRLVRYELRGNRPHVIKAAGVAMPEGLDLSSPQAAEAVGAFVGQTLQEMRLAGCRAVMCLPRGQAVLKTLTLPEGTPPEELPSMVQFQIAKELPFAPEEAVVDFIVEGHVGSASEARADAAPGGIEVLVAAVQRRVVDFYKQVAEKAAVELTRLGLRPYTNLRCVDRCVRLTEQECIVVVDLSADEAEIDIIIGRALAFSRAARIKVPANGQAESEFQAAAETVAMEVVRSIQSFQTLHQVFGAQSAGQVGIDAVLIAGDTGLEDRAVELLRNRFDAKCERFDPLGELRVEHDGSSGFVAALGLALSQGESSGDTFDFLNPKRPPVKRNVKKMAAGIGAAVFGTVFLITAVAGAVSLSGKKSQFNALEANINSEKQKNAAVSNLAKRVAALEEWESHRVNWLDHWAYVTCAFPSATDAFITDFTTKPSGSISFTVKARNGQVVTDLAEKLGGLPVYKFNPGKLATTPDIYGLGYNSDTTMTVILAGALAPDWTNLVPAPRPVDDASAELISHPPERRSEPPLPPKPPENPQAKPPENTPATPPPTQIQGSDQGQPPFPGRGRGGRRRPQP